MNPGDPRIPAVFAAASFATGVIAVQEASAVLAVISFLLAAVAAVTVAYSLWRLFSRRRAVLVARTTPRARTRPAAPPISRKPKPEPDNEARPPRPAIAATIQSRSLVLRIRDRILPTRTSDPQGSPGEVATVPAEADAPATEEPPALPAHDSALVASDHDDLTADDLLSEESATPDHLSPDLQAGSDAPAIPPPPEVPAPMLEAPEPESEAPEPVSEAPKPELEEPEPTAEVTPTLEPENKGGDVAPDPCPELQHYKYPETIECVAVAEALLWNASVFAEPTSVHIWLEDPATATLRLIGAAGPMSPSQEPISTRSGVLGESVQDGGSHLERLSTIHRPDGTETIWRYAFPVHTNGNRGAVGIDIVSEDAPDAEALNEMSAAFRGAIAGCVALYVARAETESACALMESSRELSRLLDPQRVIEATLARAMALSGAVTGSIMLLDANGVMHIAASKGLSKEIVDSTAVREGEGIAGWVLASRQPLLVEDLPGEPSRSRRPGVRSAVSVPISDEQGMLGVLNVGSGHFPARLTRSHLSTLEFLARQAAVALRNANAVNAVRQLYFATLRALAIAMETKDPYAAGATERVLSYALAIGNAMGLDEADSQALEIAALLHDIGMEAAGDAVTGTDRPLSTVERGILKMHPVLAAEILQQAPALAEVVPIVYHHHEWYNGQGYVLGIAGDEIPLGARILSVADAYVAMTSDRPYRRAKSTQSAIAELQDKAGTQFDPEVVHAFVEILGAEQSHAPH